MKAQIGLTAASVMFFGNNALARPIETAVVPGFSIRNGDWVVVDALGVVLFSGPCPCDMSDFLGSGILSLEARVTRMYGLTSWKPAIGWMVAVDNPHDVHGQTTFVGGGW